MFGLSTAFAKDPKEKVIILSWGDLIGDHTGDKRFEGAISVERPEDMKSLANLWKEKGVSKVLFRVDDWRYLHFMELYMPDGGDYTQYRRTMERAWDSGVIPAAVSAMKAAGIGIYMWISIIDEGCPPVVPYADIVPWPWQSRFFKEHPQYQASDRTPTENGRRYHWGIPEFAYPEVRAHLLAEISFFSDKFAFDGIFLSFRSHSPPPEHADQFGFNAPVVEAYQRRYGKNILRENFDLEKWRALRGEYLTQLLRECSALIHAKGKLLSFGTARGDYVGFPLGNMKLEWKKWISERIIDELHLDEQGWAWGRHGYGYLTDPVTGRGLRPIDEMVRTDYGPLAKQYGVKLYFKPGLYPNQDAAWKERVAGMPEFAGVIERPNYQ